MVLLAVSSNAIVFFLMGDRAVGEAAGEEARSEPGKMGNGLLVLTTDLISILADPSCFD